MVGFDLGLGLVMIVWVLNPFTYSGCGGCGFSYDEVYRWGDMVVMVFGGGKWVWLFLSLFLFLCGYRFGSGVVMELGFDQLWWGTERLVVIEVDADGFGLTVSVGVVSNF